MAALFTPEIDSVFNSLTPVPRVGNKPLFDENVEKTFNRSSTQPKVDPVVQAYNELPEYQKALQAADDIVRMFSTGAMYGSDAVIGGEETERLNDEARRRAPVPAAIAELVGSFASPVTRAVGAGAKAIAPMGKGLMKWLGRAATTSAEGATIGGIGSVFRGEPEDFLNDATMGAILPHGVNIAGKAITGPSKHVTSWMSGRRPENYNIAFNVGRTGDKAVNESFTRGLRSKSRAAAAASREERRAWRAGHNLAKIRPSRTSIGTAANAFWPAYFIDPSTIGLAVGALAAGSPRLGANVAHGIGKILSGVDTMGSHTAQTVLPVEQYNRTGKIKKKKDGKGDREY